jgi:hypothetical protein
LAQRFTVSYDKIDHLDEIARFHGLVALRFPQALQRPLIPPRKLASRLSGGPNRLLKKSRMTATRKLDRRPNANGSEDETESSTQKHWSKILFQRPANATAAGTQTKDRLSSESETAFIRGRY